MASYAIYLAEDADKFILNRIFNVIQNDAGDNISQPANATGSDNDPFTHWYGGMDVDEAWLALYQNLPARIDSGAVTAPGGWPWTVEEVEITKQDAVDAASRLVITAVTGNGLLSTQALMTALNTSSLKVIQTGP